MNFVMRPGFRISIFLLILLAMKPDNHCYAQNLDPRKSISPEVREIDTLQKIITASLPYNWKLTRYDRRLIISRKDSGYLRFDVPLNPDYEYDTTKESWVGVKKYPVEIYVDFLLNDWNDSTLKAAKHFNDSITNMITAAEKSYTGNTMQGYDRLRARVNLLKSQLIRLPIKTDHYYAIYLTDNRMEGSSFFGWNTERYQEGPVLLSREIKKLKGKIKDVILSPQCAECHFYLRYSFSGLGSNIGSMQPTLNVHGNKFVYTLEQNSYYGKRTKLPDTIQTGIMRQTSLDSILEIIKLLPDTTIYHTNPGIMSGGIHVLSIANKRDTVVFELCNTFDYTALKITRILNRYLPKDKKIGGNEEMIRREEEYWSRFGEYRH